MRTLKVVTLSAGVAAGLLGLTALASSAYAQNDSSQPYREDAPNSAGQEGPVDYYNYWWYAPSGPYYYGGPVAKGPYWLGAPNATGPSD